MTGAGDKERVICRDCGKDCAGRVPKGGDGSALFPVRHKDSSGQWCWGTYVEALKS